jgi:hypothetical protein
MALRLDLPPLPLTLPNSLVAFPIRISSATSEPYPFVAAPFERLRNLPFEGPEVWSESLQSTMTLRQAYRASWG